MAAALACYAVISLAVPPRNVGAGRDAVDHSAELPVAHSEQLVAQHQVVERAEVPVAAEFVTEWELSVLLVWKDTQEAAIGLQVEVRDVGFGSQPSSTEDQALWSLYTDSTGRVAIRKLDPSMILEVKAGRGD